MPASTVNKGDLSTLESALGHVFADKDLIKRALTHSSAAAQNNNERLEFLGDRVLGLAIAEILFRRFPGENEGDLAKRLAALAQGELLAKIAMDVAMGSYIDLSAAERSAGGGDNQNILADCLEAVIGALYLDAGYPACRALVERLWAEHFDAMVEPPQHPKTALQEWAQAKGLGLPTYTITGQHGPDHAPIFDVRLSVDSYPDVMASGRSRQIAERDAALLFLQTHVSSGHKS